MGMLNEGWVRQALADADRAAGAKDLRGVTTALRRLPSELFLLLYFDPLDSAYPRLREWLPPLPSEHDQRLWAGNSGLYLMQQGNVFVDRMFEVYARGRTVDLSKMKVLDYGCGWGRLMRMLYRYVPADHITGLDPWPPSLDRCAQTRVKGELKQIDYIPKSLPVKGPFDLIFAYSVFTHISERAQTAALKAMRNVIAKDGLLALTIRQVNYWEQAPDTDTATRKMLLEAHTRNGFAFHRHSDEATDRATDYGDTSQTLDYIRRNWTDWKLVEVDWRLIDEFQTYVFLKPA